MAVTRRNFLKTGSLVALTAGVPLTALGKSASTPVSASQPLSAGLLAQAGSHLNMAAFARLVNTKFELSHPSTRETTVVLKKIKDWRGADQSKGECFSLVLEGQSGSMLPQNTYHVTHASLGTFSMLVVPAGPLSGGPYYEALFNRLR